MWRIAIIVLCLPLFGCFEAEQNFTFRSDGSALLKIKLKIDAALIALTENNGGTKFCGSGSVVREDLEGLRVSAIRATEGRDITCEIGAEGDIETVVQALRTGRLTSGEPASAEDKQSVALEKIGSTYILLITLPPLGADGKIENSTANGMESLLLASMAGRVLSWTVEAPQILETSGTLSEDMKSASFSVPVATAFANKTDRLEFKTVFTLDEPGFAGWFRRLLK